VTAFLDANANTANWLFQAIDPETGEVIQDPDRGLLPPNNAQGRGSGFVAYTIKPKDDLSTGTAISAQARLMFNTSPPEDTVPIVFHIDGVAPTTTLTARLLAGDAADYRGEW